MNTKELITGILLIIAVLALFGIAGRYDYEEAKKSQEFEEAHDEFIREN